MHRPSSQLAAPVSAEAQAISLQQEQGAVQSSTSPRSVPETEHTKSNPTTSAQELAPNLGLLFSAELK